jgi:hypothetical protein
VPGTILIHTKQIGLPGAKMVPGTFLPFSPLPANIPKKDLKNYEFFS